MRKSLLRKIANEVKLSRQLTLDIARYRPVSAPILELESLFAKFENPSRQFIQWVEQFLTNNKAGPCHSSSLSFRNCMVRVPGSFNSKLVQLNEKGEIITIPESGEVKIIQKWNRVRPSIKPLLSDFYIYFADLKIKEIQRRRPRKYSAHYENNHTISFGTVNNTNGLRLGFHKFFSGPKHRKW
jgi:hypothetical protein